MLNKEITISSGQIIKMILDDEDFNSIIFLDKNYKEIGKFQFKTLTDDSPDYKLMYMNLDIEYTRQGLGKNALLFFKNETGAKIFTSKDDGLTRQDSSHLTGNAPMFVSKMKKNELFQGIIYKNIVLY